MNHRSVARLVQSEATTEGAGFQINRPFPTFASDEMTAPRYRDVEPADIPIAQRSLRDEHA